MGAYGGRRDIMEYISPTGPVYQAGTLSGNPLAMAAGLAQLTELKENPHIYGKLEESGAYLEKGLTEAAEAACVDVRINRVGSMLSVFFTDVDVTDFNTACRSDAEKFKRYFNAMLRRGIYLAPSQFESVFISAAHTREDLDKTINAAYESMREI